MLSLTEWPPREPHAYRPRPPQARTCLSGKLVFGEGAFLTPEDALTLDCTIRDLSTGGAKVVLARRQPLPFDVYLIVVKNCVVHHVKIVWLSFPARGLKFCNTYPLSGNLPGELLFLRKLWSALNVRRGRAFP